MSTEAAEHASGGGFPPFDQIDTFPSQIFWLAVTFGVLYFAVSNFLLPKLRGAIEDREAKIVSDVAEAAATSAKADEAVKAFEDIARARANARETAAQAKSAVDADIAAETAKVEAELNRKLSEAEARIAEVRTAAMANVAAVAEDTASAIVEKLTGVQADATLLKKAVTAAAAQG